MCDSWISIVHNMVFSRNHFYRPKNCENRLVYSFQKDITINAIIMLKWRTNHRQFMQTHTHIHTQRDRKDTDWEMQGYERRRDMYKTNTLIHSLTQSIGCTGPVSTNILSIETYSVNVYIFFQTFEIDIKYSDISRAWEHYTPFASIYRKSDARKCAKFTQCEM